MMLIRENHVFELRIETKFEVCFPAVFFYMCFSANDTTRQAQPRGISLVCVGNSRKVEQVFVNGEGQAFFESHCDLVKELVDLISAYYVFDVRYPSSSQVFFTFCKRFCCCAAAMNTITRGMPPLWRS